MATAKISSQPRIAKATSKPIAAKKAPLAEKPKVSVKVGQINATINGKKIAIKDSNIGPFNKAFVIDGGKTIAYSGMDGSGGFEGEGQSLRLYDVATGKTTKVMSGYFMIDTLKQVKTADGKSALLVGMSDGGLGGDHFSIVDPKRGGEVFQSKTMAKFHSIKGNIIKLAKFNEESYMNDTGKARPIGYEAINLATVLKNPIIINKNYHLDP